MRRKQTQSNPKQTQPVVSLPALPALSEAQRSRRELVEGSKVEVSNLFQTGHLFYVAKESVFSVVVFLEATCSTKASRHVVRVESSWPSKVKMQKLVRRSCLVNCVSEHKRKRRWKMFFFVLFCS